MAPRFQVHGLLKAFLFSSGHLFWEHAQAEVDRVVCMMLLS